MIVIQETFTTSQVAQRIGIHPNTVRMYETWGLVSKPERRPNGYRIYTPLHLYQFKLARTALQVEILQNGLRKKAIAIVKLSASCAFEQALDATDDYLSALSDELKSAHTAVEAAASLLDGRRSPAGQPLNRKAASHLLGISVDTLRNWEMNGLLTVKRKANGYRIYDGEDLRKLQVIRALRCANYSLSAIRRLINVASKNATIDVAQTLNTPAPSEDIISVCDRLIDALVSAQNNAINMKTLLNTMQLKFSNPPL
ncbi:MerR family transcriptional regulator [Fusibacter sp. JL298sf-3]